jgi:hypothetical protein
MKWNIKDEDLKKEIDRQGANMLTFVGAHKFFYHL